MKRIHKIYIALSCLMIITMNAVQAQPDSVWILKFIHKNKIFKPGKEDYVPDRKGFFFYQNGIYDLWLKNDMVYEARIIQVKKDSIIFTTHPDQINAKDNYGIFDTLRISASEIKKIRLLGDRIMSLYSSVAMKNYRYEFVRSEKPKRMRTDTLTDTIHHLEYFVYYHINNMGADPYYSLMDQTRQQPVDSFELAQKAKQNAVYKKRNIAWFTPLNASEINGLAMGVHTGNISGASLKIKGININADVPAMFISMFMLMHVFDPANVKMLPDSSTFPKQVSVSGLSISYGGLHYGKKLKGLFINGGICQSEQANGIFITGMYNTFQDFKGLSIGGFRNTATNGTGIQIGFINSCKRLKGVQIGLWNINGKRKLPFINWS
ncbi:MAG: hypothetical protein ABJA78_18790 [Ferruginibacter sp.]